MHKINRYKTYKNQGEYKTQGYQGNKKGVKMILAMNEKTGATELQPLYKSKSKALKKARSEDEMRHSRLQKIKNVTPSLGNNNNKTN